MCVLIIQIGNTVRYWRAVSDVLLDVSFYSLIIVLLGPFFVG